MDRKPKILVTVQQFADRETPELRPLEEAGFEILLNRRGRPLTEQELIDSLPGVFATLAGGEPYTARVFEHATDLRVVARFGVQGAVELVATIGYFAMIAMPLNAFEVDPNPEAPKLPI